MPITNVILPSVKINVLIVACAYEEIKELLQKVELKPVIDRGYMLEPVLLTYRQEQITLKGFELGYFNIPRTCKLRDLAAKLNLSTSTVSQLILKAVAKVVEDYVWREHPYVMLCMDKNLVEKEPIIARLCADINGGVGGKVAVSNA